MSADSPLNIVICWHMHQPQYCDLVSGTYQLPWTYLHATKDYIDMAAHLEAVPESRAVVNFAPVLLEQLSDYAGQINGFLSEHKGIRDPLLAALACAVLPSNKEQRMELVSACLRANELRSIKRFEHYQKLAEMAGWFQKHPSGMLYVGDQFITDLLVWYHLAWIGETVRRSNILVKQLMEKGTGFTLHDRRQLLKLIGELLSSVIDRYRKLADKGQIELSMSPYAHPILPLLLDIDCAHDAMPDVSMPKLQNYPGGKERADWHIKEGIATFEQYFGTRPTGCWPSEGGVSAAALQQLESHGFAWAATGESVFRHSQANAENVSLAGCSLYQGFRVAEGDLACFFRDDGLSDLIGFTYSDWHADDAVANLIDHLENIAVSTREQDNPLVSIILDGENAWEHFPENGYYFLNTLYQRLSEHPDIHMTTYSEYLASARNQPNIKKLVSGSWVYGTFSTWIGDKDKNRGWDMLGDAKKVFDITVAENSLSGEQMLAAQHQLSICEGSDWFWWFGDYNSADTVSDFERLFRMHLSNLYTLLGKEPPEYLASVFAHGGGSPAQTGVMRKGQYTG
ncbi:MAG TPA: glycoside hydrolase [Gammaproteobacteria bacterium]|nr:glycoside hydrolase [Gammaproteobacteria bacterium]